jgi:hypothetical protein
MTQESTILLYTYNDILEANITQDKLKAQGIDSFIENENVMGLNPVGGVKLNPLKNSNTSPLYESLFRANGSYRSQEPFQEFPCFDSI